MYKAIQKIMNIHMFTISSARFIQILVVSWVMGPMVTIPIPYPLGVLHDHGDDPTLWGHRNHQQQQAQGKAHHGCCAG